MATFKCKMCGGALEIQEGLTVIECEYCGTKQTLPKLDDERRANLYDRANHFRRNNEFDKASAIYEQILSEDNQDAEAYWSLVLCRYGIEYVEDPSTHKRLPTVNRAQYTSIFDDDNYKSAIKYADIYQKSIYEKEAKAINKIQKDFLAISQKEDPFDVFICYKETDNSGKRTRDSVLANDLYHQLTQEGFKVFFARITLENKLGSAYEPYIFAALNSAKVMVALGTKSEFFNSAWVKNEWSRYLSLIKNGAKKVLIPAYKDMDPYDLPEEFSHLQAQDMSKLGFMQDLIRGIKKIVQADTPKTTVIKETVVASNNSSVAPLLKRTFMFLEDGDWNSAMEYCEKVLDIDPENPQAYLGKLMAELQVKKQEDLGNQRELFNNRNNYKKAFRFADDKLKNDLVGYHESVCLKIYNRAKSMMNKARTEDEYNNTILLFKSIMGYKDSKELAKECAEKAEAAKKDAILSDAKAKMESGNKNAYEAAIKLLKRISSWKDADEQIEICQRRIKDLEKDLTYSDAMKQMKAANNSKQYNNAMSKYQEAISLFSTIRGWKDTDEQIEICERKKKEIIDASDKIYSDAKLKIEEGDADNGETAKEKYEEAIMLLKSISGWKDASKQREICEKKVEEIEEIARKDDVYYNAMQKMKVGGNSKDYNVSIRKYNEAIELYKSISGWKDANKQIEVCEMKIKQRKNNSRLILSLAVSAIIVLIVIMMVSVGGL